MNREMKFRVWSKRIKRMWYPKFALFEGGCIYSYNEDYELLDDAMNGRDTLDEDDIVMQYIGLNDKNGKEIYDGDIIKMKIYYHNSGETKIHRYKVIWKDIWCSWALSRLDGCQSNRLYFDETYEVIGNIYENPELLEVK